MRLNQSSNKFFRFIAWSSLISIPFLIFAFAPYAHSQYLCDIQQITDEQMGSSFRPAINENGTRIAFASTANIDGGNPDGVSVEIYLFDTLTKNFLQITDSPIGESDSPAINGNGTIITFQSNANLNGDNPDGNDEIYLFNTNTSTLTNITKTTHDSHNPTISADGTKITFFTDADLTGNNPDGNLEIFLYDTISSTFTQITNTTGESNANPKISADGTRISFESEANILGPNPGGFYQVYVFDINTKTFTRITNDSTGDSLRSAINRDGTKITFWSNANLNGQNPEGNGEFYLFDTNSSILTQITFTTPEFNSESEINGNGDRIAFTSRANINGQNPNLTQSVYLFEVATKRILKVIDLPEGFFNLLIGISLDGESIAFATDSNVNGRNPENNTEIYLAKCPVFESNVIPTLSEWGLIAMAGVLGLIGLLAIHRRIATT